MKFTSIENAVSNGPFNRFSRFRDGLLLAVGVEGISYVVINGKVLETSTHSNADLVREVEERGFALADLQYIYDVTMNPAIASIEYKEFVIGTPDVAAVDELKAMVEPFRLHKGTLIEPIEFKGKQAIKYRVVAYDDLITQLKTRYATVTVAVGA